MDPHNMRADPAERNEEIDRDFDWCDDAAEVIVPHADAIAVYINPRNRIAIRQEGGERRALGLCADDPWIVIEPEHAERLARAILDAASECRERRAEPDQPVTAEPAPPIAPSARRADPTAAAQPRYRERQRGDAHSNANPIPRPPAATAEHRDRTEVPAGEKLSR